MSLGDGIFWSTIAVLLAAAIYQISIRKKWKLVGKAFSVLLACGAVAGLTVWAFLEFEDSPTAVKELVGIHLGMEPVEVRLRMGPASLSFEPSEVVDDPEPGRRVTTFWSYGFGEYNSRFVYLHFHGDSVDSLRVTQICENNSYSKIFGLGAGDLEAEVLSKLGEPSHVSINREGTSKYLSYEQWLVAFSVEKGRIRHLCIAEDGVVSFQAEYRGETQRSESNSTRPVQNETPNQ